MTQRTFEEQQKITLETLGRCDYGTLMNFYEKTDELIETIQKVFDTVTESDTDGEFNDKKSIFSAMADGELAILNACLKVLRDRRYHVHADGEYIGEFNGTDTAELAERLIETYNRNTPQEERYYHVPKAICGQTIEDTLKIAQKFGLISRYRLEIIRKNGKGDK